MLLPAPFLRNAERRAPRIHPACPRTCSWLCLPPDQLFASPLPLRPPGLTAELDLVGVAGTNHSVTWRYLLVEMMHASVDNGCAEVTRNVRRALRKRQLRLPALNSLHSERRDGMVSSLHTNYAALLYAAAGLPMTHIGTGDLVRGHLSLLDLKTKITEQELRRRAALSKRDRLNEEKRAKAGLPPEGRRLTPR